MNLDASPYVPQLQALISEDRSKLGVHDCGRPNADPAAIARIVDFSVSAANAVAERESRMNLAGLQSRVLFAGGMSGAGAVGVLQFDAGDTVLVDPSHVLALGYPESARAIEALRAMATPPEGDPCFWYGEAEKIALAADRIDAYKGPAPSKGLIVGLQEGLIETAEGALGLFGTTADWLSGLALGIFKAVVSTIGLYVVAAGAGYLALRKYGVL